MTEIRKRRTPWAGSRQPGEELLAVVACTSSIIISRAAVELARRQSVDRLELRRHLPPVCSQIPLERAHARRGHRNPSALPCTRLLGRRRPLVDRSPRTHGAAPRRYPHRIFSGGRPGPRKLGAPVGGRGLRVPSQLRVPGAHDARRCHRAPRRARRRREGAGRRPEPHPAHETAVRGADGAHRHQRRRRPRRRDRLRSRRHRHRRTGPPQGLRAVRASARALCDPRPCGAADLRPDRAKPRDGVRLARARRPAGRLGVGAARGGRGGRDPRTGRRVAHELHRRSARRPVHDDARAERDHHRGTRPRPGGRAPAGRT